jgi:hypothetical protein
MKYLTILLLLIASVYPFSYARYNFIKKNYLGAVGMALLALAAIVFPVIMILSR